MPDFRSRQGTFMKAYREYGEQTPLAWDEAEGEKAVKFAPERVARHVLINLPSDEMNMRLS